MAGSRPKAYMGDGSYIFVSYSHKDLDRVDEFIKLLQTRYNVWFDEGIHFGAEWDEEIVNKLYNCSLFIFVITKNSLESKNCKDEIAFAKDNDIPFINLLFDDIELPNVFKLKYGRYQMAKYFEYKNKEELLDDLERRCEAFNPDKRYDSYETDEVDEEYEDDDDETYDEYDMDDEDEEDEPIKPGKMVKTSPSSKPSSLSFVNLVIENISGNIVVKDASAFACSIHYEKSNGTIQVINVSDNVTIGVPPGKYNLLLITNVSGNIDVKIKKATFSKVSKQTVSGTITIH